MRNLSLYRLLIAVVAAVPAGALAHTGLSEGYGFGAAGAAMVLAGAVLFAAA